MTDLRGSDGGVVDLAGGRAERSRARRCRRPTC